jgi:RHS repeat-associated protein
MLLDSAMTPVPTVAYDANGNTLADAQGRGFTWDFENRLTQVVNPSVGATTFRYDPFGRRIQKSGPLGTTNYLYDVANLLEQVDSSGNALAKFTQEPDADSPLSIIGSGTTSYYERDGLGSVTSLSSSTGSLANTYTFGSFGNLTASTGSLTNPLQYVGREFDPETALLSDRARYYDSGTGRFVSEDPIRFLGSGSNFYAYVSNNPTNLIDPYGLTDCVVTPVATVCTNRGLGLNWMEPHDPQPPLAPPELWPIPGPCGCDKIKKIEDEATKERWKTILEFGGTTSAVQAVEHWGKTWMKRLVPVADAIDFTHLEYSFWKIERNEEKR